MSLTRTVTSYRLFLKDDAKIKPKRDMNNGKPLLSGWVFPIGGNSCFISTIFYMQRLLTSSSNVSLLMAFAFMAER